MRQTWLLVFVISMMGCVASTPPVDITFAEFEEIQGNASYPEELPKIKELQCFPSGNDCAIAGYDKLADVDTFEIYTIRAEANTIKAEQNAIALDAAISQGHELVLAGRSQENVTAIVQDQLQFEKSERTKEKWYYRGMMILMGGVLIITAN